MFTGIIESLASVASIDERPPGRHLLIRAGRLVADARVGDSIAVNGCCLTVVSAQDDTLAFDAGPETLSRTNLGELKPGGQVNLERSLRMSDRLGGHFVTGHVDGTGTLLARRDEADWATLWFSFPSELRRQLVSKGSIAVDGVSLTLVDVESDRFSVALIPHTLAHTTLGKLAIGGRVNLETDLLAKYVQQQMGGRS
jgi:riboflavin synthase